MNSFSNVERAIDVEYQRQVTRLAAGERVVSQTLLWDADRSRVRPQRSKEETHDYRYFPEPDLPPLELEESWVEAQRAALPELPGPRRARLQQAFGVSAYEAGVLTASRALADYYEAVALAHGDGRAAGSWIMGEVQAYLNHARLDVAQFPIAALELARLLDLIREGTVSRTAAKRIFEVLVTTGGSARAVAEREGLLLVSDDGSLQAWVDEVCHAHPAEVRRLVGGEKKLLGVLVGAVMKASGGRADPKRVNQLLNAKVGA